MLIRFSVRNFKSFGVDGASLDMVSSAKIRQHKSHELPCSEAKVLRNAVIYGANSAGKSNVIGAMRFMRECLLRGLLPRGAAESYCRIDPALKDEESLFDIQIGIGGRVYDYGFGCILDKGAFTSEWLYELHPSSRGEVLFEYERGDDSVRFGDALLKAMESSPRLRVYTDDFEQSGAFGSSLFLSFLNQAKSYRSDDEIIFFKQVFSWFAKGMVVVSADQPNMHARFYADRDLDDVAKLVASFDTGIDCIRKERITIEDLKKALPPGVVEKALVSIDESAPAGAPLGQAEKASVVIRSDVDYFGIEFTSFSDPVVTRMSIGHKGTASLFRFGEESDGTKRLFDFIDMLLSSDEETLFVVDELNRSFHPLMTRHFVELFNEAHADDRCQLVFTTHENDIMSFEFFRRDEIWFVERDAGGYSRMYPLDDFKDDDARSDARVGKRYMEGRYGGVPVLMFVEALEAIRG